MLVLRCGFGVDPYNMYGTLREGFIGVLEDVGTLLYIERANGMRNINEPCFW
jgi:hypothetical protein